MPSRSRVMLSAVLSANHTAPSGAMASWLSRAMGVPVSANEVTAPYDVTRDTARAGESVNHAALSAAMASPIGSTLGLPLGIFAILPSRSTPIASEDSMVNQMLPSRPTATAVGMSLAPGIRYSTKPLGRHGAKRQSTPAAAAATSASPISSHERRRKHE